MEIKLTKEACFMLFRMLWQPNSLGEDKAYQAKDEVARAEVVTIMRWLSTKVYRTVDKGLPQERFEFDAFTGTIKQRFIDRMLDVAKHYDKSGRQVQNVISYTDLMTGLTGKDSVAIESVEEGPGAPKDPTVN